MAYCLNLDCGSVLMPHEGYDHNPYYWGYCDECCKARKEESDREDDEFDLRGLIDDYVEFKRKQKEAQ